MGHLGFARRRSGRTSRRGSTRETLCCGIHSRFYRFRTSSNKSYPIRPIFLAVLVAQLHVLFYCGLWRGRNPGGPMPECFPEAPIMLVAHNFDGITSYQNSKAKGGRGAIVFLG